MVSTWVDSHCHLFGVEEPVSALMDRAAAAGVAWVMIPGIDMASSLSAKRIAEAHYGRAIWSAGLHPHYAASWEAQRATIETLAIDAAAIGECGLDFYRDLSPREDQLTAFRDQLDLARRLEKPVIIHCRDAFADVYAILDEFQLGEAAILHCWTGGPKWTRRFDGLGCTFSFAGHVTFDGGDTVRLGAAQSPPDRTMVETDTPYLTPPPDRRAVNEPANVVRIGEALARIWSMPIAEVAELTTATACRVFGVPGE